jgi:predicted metal-dependent peptidase
MTDRFDRSSLNDALANIDDRMEDHKLTVVPDDRLAEPRPGNGAAKLAESIVAKIDESTGYTANELDQLIAEIREIKERTIKEADLVKVALEQHFVLTAEALAFRERVSKRLNGLTK